MSEVESWRAFTNSGYGVPSAVFDQAFDSDKIVAFSALIPRSYEIMESIVGREVDWPDFIDAMTDDEIAEGESVGGGHGLYDSLTQSVKINPKMSAFNIFLNFIHENFHHSNPELVGPKTSRRHRHIEINERMLPAFMSYMNAYVRSNPDIANQVWLDILNGISKYVDITRMSRLPDPTYQPHMRKK